MFGFLRKLMKTPERRMAEYVEGEQLTIYDYHLARHPDPGVRGVVFSPRFTLPPQNPFGHSVLVNYWQVLPPAPMVLTQRNIPVSGLGGIVAGQMALQPLLIPPGATATSA